jgi:type IV pilus biogenesis protein PilP
MALGILVALLALLAGIWALFFMPKDDTSLFTAPQDQFEAAITSDPIDDGSEGDLDDAFLALEEEEGSPPEPEQPTPHEPLSPEAAQARYAATGIWQRAPDTLSDPKSSSLADLYIASIDGKINASDAIALPSFGALELSNGAINTAPPPAAGTTFALDSNGLVRATPQGALTPNGVLVIAGRPSVAPAPRPGNAQAETPPEAPQTTTPTIRPRARPAGLVEGNERSQLGGRTLAELGALRPRARPQTEQFTQTAEPQEADPQDADAQALAIASAVTDDGNAGDETVVAALSSPTKRAVESSILPRSKPRNFDKIVQRGRDNADASDGTSVAAAPSRQQSFSPKIPTRTSVAKQATVKNAINLRKVNLIGIYGSSASRNALVRLPSGRFVKVKKGSRLDGGKVLSISSTKVVYKKGSRTHTLEILPFG